MNLYCQTDRMIEILEALETNYYKYAEILSKLESISDKTRVLEEKSKYNLYENELYESCLKNKTVLSEYYNLIKKFELIIDLYWSAESRILNSITALPITISNKNPIFEIERISLNNPGIFTDNWIDSLIIGGRKERNE